MQDDFTTATASGEEDAALDPEELDALEEERTSVREAVLLSPDVLASIMSQLGLRASNMVAAVSTAWRHASLSLQEERRVVRPSHSLGWGNETLGQFKAPSGIIPLPSGDLCVSDTNNHRLQVLSRSGEVRSILGAGPGGGVGQFQQPTGLACDGDALYVADSGNCRLHKLSLPGGHPISTAGTFGDAAGQLHAPVGLALLDGRLYCADSRNHRIAVFETSPALRYVTSFGSHGSGPHELGSTSSGIYLAAYHSPGLGAELFIGDRSNHRLLVLGIDGSFHRSIGSRGTAPGCFRRLRGVAVSEAKIFTAECERVQVLTLSGEPLQVLALAGSSALVGICADSTHVCVVDQSHQKVSGSPLSPRPPRATHARSHTHPAPRRRSACSLSSRARGARHTARRASASRTCDSSCCRRATATARTPRSSLSPAASSRTAAPPRARRRRCARGCVRTSPTC